MFNLTAKEKFSSYWIVLITRIEGYNKNIPATKTDICTACHNLEEFTLKIAQNLPEFRQNALLFAASLKTFREYFSQHYELFDTKQMVARQILRITQKHLMIDSWQQLIHEVRKKTLLQHLKDSKDTQPARATL